MIIKLLSSHLLIGTYIESFGFRYFKNFTNPEYAKSGAIMDSDIIIPPGPLTFPGSMLDHLRKLGMIVEIDDSIIYLREPYTAATAGEAVTPEQAKVLTHFDKKTVNFKIKLLCHWTDGNYEDL